MLWYDARMRELANEQAVGELIRSLQDKVRRDLAVAGRPWAVIGIKSRGETLAQRLASTLKPDHVGSLDITMYRDDLSEIGSHAVVRTTDVRFAIDGIDVVLVDDVLMSGRSVRAALAALTDLGRPRRVWLSVLVDRGGRELPIRADHVALDLSADPSLSPAQRVDVLLTPFDERDAIIVRAPSRPTVRQVTTP
jgi:pyrimidine operon attenuation protein / uracil phosphoribosyltransferase